MRALEQFSTDLQKRYDTLEKKYAEKDNAIRQLMTSDIAQKVTD